MKQSFKSDKAFSLVEIMIVIGIITALVSVVLASNTAARAKARDERRMADLRQIEIGLALYHDVNRSYPGPGIHQVEMALIGDKYLPEPFPTDPAGSTYPQYEYKLNGTKYCLGAKLERTSAIPVDSAVCVSKAGTSDANYKVSR